MDEIAQVRFAGLKLSRPPGIGSRTVTHLTTEWQPPLLQAWSWTCLVPAPVKVTTGLAAVEVPANAAAAPHRKSASEQRTTVRGRVRGKVEWSPAQAAKATCCTSLEDCGRAGATGGAQASLGAPLVVVLLTTKKGE